MNLSWTTMRIASPCILIIALTLTPTPSAWAVTTTPNWKAPEFVGFSNFSRQQGDRFLAFDNYGVASMAYSNFTGDVELARRLDGIGWAAIEAYLSSTVDVSGVSLDFSRSELPGISFGDSAGLHYTTFDPTVGLGTFVDELIDDSAMSGRDWSGGTSIAFDRLGRPAIAATEFSAGGNIFFVTDNDGDGTLTSLDTLQLVDGFASERPTLAFDGLNRPVIGVNFPAFAEVYVKDPFVGWWFNTVATPTTGAFPGSVPNVSVAIDPDDGLPALAWTDQGAGELWYGKWNSTTNVWDLEFVDVAALGTELGNESLAFDPADGHPAISYSDEVGNIFFAWHDGSVWDTQFVTNSGVLVPSRTSLAFNEFGHGFPAIGFIVDNLFSDVYYVVDPPLAAVPEPNSLVLLLLGMAGVSLARRRAAGGTQTAYRR